MSFYRFSEIFGYVELGWFLSKFFRSLIPPAEILAVCQQDRNLGPGQDFAHQDFKIGHSKNYS